MTDKYDELYLHLKECDLNTKGLLTEAVQQWNWDHQMTLNIDLTVKWYYERKESEGKKHA